MGGHGRTAWADESAAESVSQNAGITGIKNAIGKCNSCVIVHGKLHKTREFCRNRGGWKITITY
jgi:hypothetical protein